MRSTVGPLPPAVYWRRRAVVLGALLLVVIVFFVSCGGEDEGDPRGSGATTPPPTPAPAESAPGEEPSFSDAAPGAGPSLPAPEDIQSQPGGPGGVAPSGGADGTGNNPNGTGNNPNGTGNNANVTAPADGSCADQEIAVTPVPSAASVKRGAAVTIRLKIKNVSTRACTRDLGAGAQELYIDQGARKYWSSDTCSTDRSNNPQRMQPGAEFEFTVTWNGRQSSKCEGVLAAGPNPPPGTYEIRGRLGQKISQPVALTIQA